MRDIRLRAWDKLNKRWIRIWKLVLNGDGSIAAVVDLEGDNEWYGLHQVEVMLYTGLHDKSGRKIWELDIVVHSRNARGDSAKERKVVVWISGGFTLQEDYPDGDFEEYPICEYDLEVIGNVYEHPELVRERPGKDEGSYTVFPST